MIEIFADGSCLGNPGPGGWACIIRQGEDSRLLSGCEEQTTNNRQELRSALEGLLNTPDGSLVRMVMDSRYVIDGFEKNWVKSWKKNGWKTASKAPVKNRDLWEALHLAVEARKVTWEWVRGHSGHRENDVVDAEAKRQAKIAQTNS